jgi:hypothetical protein
MNVFLQPQKKSIQKTLLGILLLLMGHFGSTYAQSPALDEAIMNTRCVSSNFNADQIVRILYISYGKTSAYFPFSYTVTATDGYMFGTWPDGSVGKFTSNIINASATRIDKKTLRIQGTFYRISAPDANHPNYFHVSLAALADPLVRTNQPLFFTYTNMSGVTVKTNNQPITRQNPQRVSGLKEGPEVYTLGGSLFCNSSCGTGFVDVAPNLGAASVEMCGSATTFDLSRVTASNLPAGMSINWYNSSGNRLSSLLVPTGTYYAVFTNGTCNTASTALTVTNNTSTAPVVNATSISNVCPVATVNLGSLVGSTCPSGSSLEWHTTNTNLSSSSKVSNPSAVSSSGIYYPVCYNPTYGCYGLVGNGVTATLLSVPAVPTGMSANPSTICSGTNSTLNANCSSGSVKWYTNPNGTGTALSSNVVSPTTTTDYYGVCANGTCSGLVSGALRVTVNDSPASASGVSANPSVICSGSSSTLSANCSSGNSVRWYTNPNGTGTALSSNVVSPTTTTDYYAVCDNGTCSSVVASSSNVRVTVNSIPASPTSLGVNPSTICSGSSSTLGASCSSGSVKWYTNANGTGTALPSNVVSPTTTTTYYAVCYNGTCNSMSSIGVTVTVTVVPAASGILANPSTICSGSSSTLNAACSVGSVKWYTNANGTGTALSSIVVSPTTTTDYYAVCDNGTCTSVVSAALRVTVSTCGPTEPNLSPTINISSLNFAPGSAARDFVVNIFEKNGVAHKSGSIIFKVQKLTAFTISYSTVSEQVNVGSNVLTSNSDWDFSDTGDFIVVTAKAGKTIPPNGSKAVGFRIVRNTNVSRSTQNLTATINFGSSGEVFTEDNAVVTSITAD